jgi:hypothetical protein
MNWSPLQNEATVDNYINQNVYFGTMTQGEGIDLRVEMNWILYGRNTFPIRKPKGHWIVYRRFDRTQKSQYYSERTKEGVGGPAYVYTDSLLRTRRVPTDKAGLPIDGLKLGGDITDKYLYYFEYTVVPKVGDQIYEIQWADHAITPTLGNINYTDRYVIKRVHDYRLEDGNVQYYVVSAQYDEVNY